jgi:translation elongation factor EF-Tu-like GTPase
MLKPHFIALVNFNSEKEGGRKTPTSSGYRSHLKFSFHAEPILAEQHFTDAELVFSGDQVTSEITLISSIDFTGKIYSGLDFDFYEGEHLVGRGIVTKILLPCL